MNLKSLLSFSFLVLMTVFPWSGNAQSRSTTLYVDASYAGSSSDGSSDDPFKTIKEALDYRQSTLGLAGMVSDEEIIVRAGVYAPDSNGMIVLTQYNGGTGSYWLTLKTEGEVIIDGENLYNKKFAALITITSAAKNVRVQGFKLRDHRCNQSLATTETINGTPTLVKDTKFGIQVANSGENIEIIGNEIYDFSWTVNVDPMKDRLDFTAAEIDTLKSAAPNDNIGPISIVGTDSLPLLNVVVKNNLIHHVIPGWTEGIQLNGHLDGFEVSNNTIYEVQNIGIVAAGHYTWVPDIQGATVSSAQNYARNGVIKDNKVWSCRSPIAAAAGIYCDGSQNITVENNEVSDCQVGFSIGNENSGVHSGGHIVRNNLSFNNSWTGLVLGVPSAASGSYINNVSITGNTIYGNGGVSDTYLGSLGSSQLIIQKNIKNLTIKNNIIYATATNNLVTFAMAFDTTSYYSTISFDYNLYYTNSTADPAVGIFDWSQLGSGYASYGTFAWYRVNRTDQDEHSSFQNPVFEDIVSSTPDFRLQSTSPAIDAGDPGYTVGTGETDIFGNERVFGDTVDIGAFESSSVAAGDIAATIDGVKSSSEGYDALQTGVTTGVWRNIHAYDDNHFIYIYGEYEGTMAEYSIFVNTNSSTGYDYIWTEKSDYYVDGTLNLLNVYDTAASPSWPFTADNSVMTIRFVKTDSTIEGRIPKYALGIGSTGTVGLGIEGHTSGWSSSLGSIPVEDAAMVYLTLDGGSDAGSLAIDGYKSPVENYSALITGVTGSSFKNIYGYTDSDYIYLYAEIDTSALWEYNVYINTNGATGYQYLWTDKSDFYIDANYNQLNEYTGSGGWPFEESTNSAGIEFVMTPLAVEGKVLKSLIGVGSSGTIGIGLEGHTKNWGASLGGVPTSGSMVYLSLAGTGSRVAQETIVELLEESARAQLVMYPNPAVDQLTISHYLNEDGPVSVSVFGLDGRKYLYQEEFLLKGSHQQVLDVSGLPRGIALVRIESLSGVTTHKVLMK